MRRLLSTVLVCCALVASCSNDSSEPTDTDVPDECTGEACGSDSDVADTADDSSIEPDPTESQPADEPDLEPDNDVDTDAVVQVLTEAWGADEDLVRCVVEELSLDDLAAIDPAAMDDPAKEVCGTSLLELMTSAG